LIVATIINLTISMNNIEKLATESIPVTTMDCLLDFNDLETLGSLLQNALENSTDLKTTHRLSQLRQRVEASHAERQRRCLLFAERLGKLNRS